MNYIFNTQIIARKLDSIYCLGCHLRHVILQNIHRANRSSSKKNILPTYIPTLFLLRSGRGNKQYVIFGLDHAAL
jgi:hypothetical protein